MKALIFDNRLQIEDIPIPNRLGNDVLIKVKYAGICNTDLEITKGYISGYNGIPGHEFIGHVVKASNSELIGKRVTGEINCACQKCEYCLKGLQRHCPNRTVLGIINRNGAFAEYVTLPEENIVLLPNTLSDLQAIFLEPLAAALEILEQFTFQPEHRVLLLGDGKLGLLIAMVLNKYKIDLTVAGKHPEKLDLLAQDSIKTALIQNLDMSRYDVVIEASGNSSAFINSLNYVKPRGTIILKSTYANNFPFNPASLIINEITLIGSRCGRIPEAIRFLNEFNIPLEKMISKIFTLENGIDAFEYSKRKGVLKVVISTSTE